MERSERSEKSRPDLIMAGIDSMYGQPFSSCMNFIIVWNGLHLKLTLLLIYVVGKMKTTGEWKRSIDIDGFVTEIGTGDKGMITAPNLIGTKPDNTLCVS
jgi:hypothetical protein